MALADHFLWFSCGSSSSGLFWCAQEPWIDQLEVGFQVRRTAPQVPAATVDPPRRPAQRELAGVAGRCRPEATGHEVLVTHDRLPRAIRRHADHRPLSRLAGIGMRQPAKSLPLIACSLDATSQENLYEVLNICAALYNVEGAAHMKLHQVHHVGTSVAPQVLRLATLRLINMFSIRGIFADSVKSSVPNVGITPVLTPERK